jgi:hypothetical protein
VLRQLNVRPSTIKLHADGNITSKLSVLRFSVHTLVPSLVVSEMSESLLEQFSHVEISVHPGGHFVPAAGPQKQSYIHFLEDRKHEMDTENRRRTKQIQVGSYTLERVDDSSSEPSEDDRHVNSQGKTCAKRSAE